MRASTQHRPRVRRLAVIGCLLVAGGELPDAAGAATTPYGYRIRPLPAWLVGSMKRTGTWHRGCPVALRDLRLLQPVYLDWSGRARTGKLVVHRDAARTLGRVFGRLYQVRFPIRRMVPVDTYGSPPDNDYRSIEADNTSAFNCRNATGSGHWSQHAYGRAVDVDPIENPYVLDGLTEHRKSRRYLDRTRRLKGMIHAGDRVERAFTHVGWGWGGRWDNPVDYQHFSATGT